VKTPLVEGQIHDQAKTRGISPEEVIRDVILAAQPTKKFVTFDELNALAIFLAGDQAASINGAAISIDGGWTAK
jgi:3-hydroxybutyrate dehydrogenase